MKYHVSRDGKTRPCRSTGPCPLGTGFDNKAQAELYSAVREDEVSKYRNAMESGEKYSKEESIKRGLFVNDTVTLLLNENQDTESLYFDKGTNEYTKKRQKLHRDILDEFHEKYNEIPSEGKSIFSAGLPGAGKTTVLNMLDDGEDGVNASNYATVSSDDFKEVFASRGMVPKVEGLTPMESSTLVHKESSHLADVFLKELSDKQKNVIYDFTCRDYNSTTRRMNVLRDSGYEEKDMQFVFVDIPMNEAEERAIGRYSYGLNEGIESKGEHDGGRYLPPEILHRNKSKTGSQSSINAETLIQVHEANREKGLPKPIVYDNSGDIFANPDYKPEKLNYDDFANK